MSEKPLEMEHFQAFAQPEEPGVAPLWVAGVAPDGRNEENGSKWDPVWSTISAGPEAKKEILVQLDSAVRPTLGW